MIKDAIVIRILLIHFLLMNARIFFPYLTIKDKREEYFKDNNLMYTNPTACHSDEGGISLLFKRDSSFVGITNNLIEMFILLKIIRILMLN